jgi:hypothetical protein
MPLEDMQRHEGTSIASFYGTHWRQLLLSWTPWVNTCFAGLSCRQRCISVSAPHSLHITFLKHCKEALWQDLRLSTNLVRS